MTTVPSTRRWERITLMLFGFERPVKPRVPRALIVVIVLVLVLVIVFKVARLPALVSHLSPSLAVIAKMALFGTFWHFFRSAHLPNRITDCDLQTLRDKAVPLFGTGALNGIVPITTGSVGMVTRASARGSRSVVGRAGTRFVDIGELKPMASFTLLCSINFVASPQFAAAGRASSSGVTAEAVPLASGVDS